MRRLGLLVIGVGGAVFGLATPAFAEPSPPAAGPGSAADTVCTVSDSRLTGLTGLTAQSDGYAVVNTSPDQSNPMRVYFLDSKCKVTRNVPYPASPRDPEDLAVAPDGTVWVADIGDNSTNQADRRSSIALWKVPAAGGGSPVIHRLTYPDGHHDARALLFGADGTPVIVTKEQSGTAQLYVPSAQLQPNTRQGVPLKNVGSWKPKRTGTPNFLGATGQILVTGAAQTPDHTRVVLRTYSDAYEWSVPDGDVVKAITTGEPRVTPLSGEAQGEGIAYSADGKSFLTCVNQSGPSKILRYQPVSAAAPAPAVVEKSATKAVSRLWYQKLSLPQIINLVAAVGVLGLVLVVVGVIGIRQSRKARRRAADEARTNLPPTGNDGNERPISIGPSVPGDPQRQGRAAVAPMDPRQQPVDPRQQPVDPRQQPVDPRQQPVDPRQQGRGPARPPVPADGQRQGRATVKPPADPQRQGRATAKPPADPQRPGRATVTPADAGRQGRPEGPPANPRPGRPVQPGGGGGGGNVYGGGQQKPGYDQRGGRQEYAQPGYRPDYGGDGRYFSERI